MKNIPRISASEWQVMTIVWEKHPITTNEVVECLSENTEWQPKTIMTMLNRLVKKGALGFEKKGRVYSYFPLVKQSECVKAESKSFLERVYGGALKPMLANFLEETELSDNEIKELKQILNKKRK